MNSPLTEPEIETVNRILVEELGVTADQIKPKAHLFLDLGADSLSIIEIGMRLEDQFNLSVSDERMEEVRTVGELHEVLADLASRLVTHEETPL
jgi:acyl carrier protein